ncbi:hypothetical protein LTR17_015432 [Elasticomyces elasticus]|nr:hypothetical protein LTR17_015432 [Elasticomyces elasticus]
MHFTTFSFATTLLAASATAMPASNYTNSSTPDALTAAGPVRITFDICSLTDLGDAVLELADAVGSKIGYTNVTIVSRDENQIVMEAVPSDAGHDNETAVPDLDAVLPKLTARQSDETPSYNVDLSEWLLTATIELTLEQIDLPEPAGEEVGDN